MPFLRYTRDKRGYEHVYLVQPTTGRKGKVRTRILYWYRTPPNVKVGRDPFDEDVRRSIEKQYPDVEFDWPKLLATPKPAAGTADVERWRERRRQMKAERAAAAAEAEAERAEADVSVSEAEQPEEAEDESLDVVTEPQAPLEGAESQITAPQSTAPAEGAADPRRKRRRRKRRGRRPDRPGEITPRVASAETPVEADESAAEPDEDEPESE